jgi:hypothetical protein
MVIVGLSFSLGVTNVLIPHPSCRPNDRTVMYMNSSKHWAESIVAKTRKIFTAVIVASNHSHRFGA